MLSHKHEDVSFSFSWKHDSGSHTGRNLVSSLLTICIDLIHPGAHVDFKLYTRRQVEYHDIHTHTLCYQHAQGPNQSRQ